MPMDLNTSERKVTAGSVLTPGLVYLQKFMFSDRYHLTASALTLNDGFHAMDNLFQSLQEISFVVAVKCLPEDELRAL